MLTTYSKKSDTRFKKKRKIIIINQSRFIIASVITLIVLSFVFTALSGILMTSASSYETYTVIAVLEGDTLWKIASENNPYELDIRKVIYDLKKQNNLKNADIYPGQLLVVPSQ